MVKKLLAAAVAAMVLTSGAWATPDPEETRMINKYGHVGIWNTHSAQTLGKTRVGFNIYANIALDKDFVKNVAWWDYQQDGAWLEYANDLNKLDYKKTTLNLSLAYGLTHYLDLGVMLPVYIDWLDNVSSKTIGADGMPIYDLYDATGRNGTKGGAGDLEISLKFQYPPYPHRNFFQMAYYGAVAVPTGKDDEAWFPRSTRYYDKKSDANFNYETYEFNQDYGSVSPYLADIMGVNAFYTSSKPEIDMKMLWTWDFREMSDNFPVLFHVNYGLRWMLQWRNEHVFYLNSGLEVRPAKWLNIFADFSAEPRFGSIQQLETFGLDRAEDRDDLGSDLDGKLIPYAYKRSLKSDPLRISPGIAFLTPIGITLSAGFDISLASKNNFFYGDQSTSLFRDNYETHYEQLIGPDGQPYNGRPYAVRKADAREQNVLIETGVEPKVAFVASLGWNGPIVKRKEPVIIQEPEPACDTIVRVDTVFVDKVVTDTVVQTVEVKQAVKTFTITASVVAGQGTISPSGVTTVNEGAFQTYTFTPAQGFSLEQVTVNGINQGALSQYSFAKVKENQIITVSFKEDVKVVEVQTPVAVEIPREGLVLRGVNFQSGKAILTSGSYEALDAVIKSLKDWPEVKIEIQGHTDSQGKRDMNMKLSKDRANAVMKYFVDQGVPSSRLRAVGFGPDVPVASNETASGRELNRRVELKRFD